MMLTLSIMMMINIMMIFMKHPLSMGMLLIMQTMMTSLLTGMMMNSFWMSYILLISMLSGALVLFIYMSSIASNEKFMNKMSMWMFCMMMISCGIIMSLLEEKIMFKCTYMHKDILYLNKMFNMENMYITIMLMLYLLLTMIVSTQLVNINEGPLRLKT
uniref:NADH dehydrogenase subunit 6 n=1 Tax=Creontiades dilutus TaxID=173679 RepID=A0A342KBM7_9HEMI|nr:NADH dehydrogenase subunit 6 [Creontiades dilutus]AND82408.1 NADH dehydrogenase subunit 6 [Creontiades dilutus]